MIKYNQHLRKYARKLRKEMTIAEISLWQSIRCKQIENIQFYRQKILGDYIIDFYCPTHKLVIEIDGGQHMEDEAIKQDESRDQYLQKLGFKVLRFNNLEILQNKAGVLQKIVEELSIFSENPS